MNTQDTNPENSPYSQTGQADYDMITVAVESKASISSLPTGFMYLRDSRFVFVTEKGTVFDVPVSEVEAVDAGSKFSVFSVTIHGKKYRIGFIGENAVVGAKEYLSQPTLDNLISQLLPSRPTTPDRPHASQHFLVPLGENDLREISQTWQSVLTEHNPGITIPVRKPGLFGRLFKSAKTPKASPVAQTPDYSEAAYSVYSRLSGAYSLATIDIILKSQTYWRNFYIEKTRTVDQPQIIDDVFGDVSDDQLIPKSAIAEVISASSN